MGYYNPKTTKVFFSLLRWWFAMHIFTKPHPSLRGAWKRWVVLRIFPRTPKGTYQNDPQPSVYNSEIRSFGGFRDAWGMLRQTMKICSSMTLPPANMGPVIFHPRNRQNWNIGFRFREGPKKTRSWTWETIETLKMMKTKTVQDSFLAPGFLLELQPKTPGWTPISLWTLGDLRKSLEKLLFIGIIGYYTCCIGKLQKKTWNSLGGFIDITI